jgi:dual specificity protein kinase YAK1
VPKFQPVKDTAELRPKINSQPPFRRANPEGGFISVSSILVLLLCVALTVNSPFKR